MTYPSGDFAGRLRALAAMLDGGLPLKVVAIESGGYDTHSNQADSLPADLLEIGDSLRAFQRDLEARGLQDRVLVHVWSEFGRRPDENGSGTDHGAAGPGFVIGSQAKGEMVGEFPGLAVLDEDDNLRNTSDFRGVYCALLEQWLGVDAGPIIPNASSFTRPALVRPDDLKVVAVAAALAAWRCSPCGASGMAAAPGRRAKAASSGVTTRGRGAHGRAALAQAAAGGRSSDCSVWSGPSTEPGPGSRRAGGAAEPAPGTPAPPRFVSVAREGVLAHAVAPAGGHRGRDGSSCATTARTRTTSWSAPRARTPRSPPSPRSTPAPTSAAA